MVKLVCINVELPLVYKIWGYELVLHEIYDGYVRYEGLQKGYIIHDIRGDWFPAEYFITLAEWRDKQIDDILK